jgi:NADP-dependent 3-hydroxy acid dehydrogenase YdfG
MLARRKDRLEQLAAELGERAFPVPSDVTELDALSEAIGAAAATIGGFDGVVAVAGRSMVGTVQTGTPERWRELIELNLLGPLATVRYALDHFADSGRRDIVIVASTGAITPMAGVGIYAATKRGLRAATDALRLELAPVDVNVTCVMPGMFETEGLTIEGMVFDGDIPPADIPWFAGEGTPGSAADLADAISFVMSRPVGFSINELVVRPTRQLNP